MVANVHLQQHLQLNKVYHQVSCHQLISCFETVLKVRMKIQIISFLLMLCGLTFMIKTLKKLFIKSAYLANIYFVNLFSVRCPDWKISQVIDCHLGLILRKIVISNTLFRFASNMYTYRWFQNCSFRGHMGLSAKFNDPQHVDIFNLHKSSGKIYQNEISLGQNFPLACLGL